MAPFASTAQTMMPLNSFRGEDGNPSPLDFVLTCNTKATEKNPVMSTSKMSTSIVPLKTDNDASKVGSSPRRLRRKVVSFNDELHIAEYPYAIGDNPGCSSGAPLTIDWTPQHFECVNFHEFDTKRQPHRRRQKDLAVSAQKRHERLINSGYTEEDVRRANRQRIKHREQRKSTIDNLELDVTLQLLQKFVWKLPKKGIQTILSGGIHNKNEKSPMASRRHSYPITTPSANTTTVGPASILKKTSQPFTEQGQPQQQRRAVTI